MNTLTGAQRYNRRMDKIFDTARKHESAISDIENVILEMVDLAQEVDRSDLQSVVEVEARKLYWKLKDNE